MLEGYERWAAKSYRATLITNGLSVLGWKQLGLLRSSRSGDGQGPPDFVGKYDDECVAVEVTRLFPSDGWGVTKEMGFAARLRTLIAKVYREFPDGPRWHVTCEYDPSQPCPSPQSTEWQDKARHALSTAGRGGRFPLISKSRRKGYGVELVLTRVKPSGAFGHLRATRVAPRHIVHGVRTCIGADFGVASCH